MNSTSSLNSLIIPFFDPATKRPDQPMIYENLLGQDSLAVWIGREKHRKSNVLLQLAISAATGRDFLWFRFAAPAPAKVMLIDYESTPTGLWDRYHAILESMNVSASMRDLLAENLRILEARRLYSAGSEVPSFPVAAGSNGSSNGLSSGNRDLAYAMRFWDQVVASFAADLYIIDPLRCFHSADENDSIIERLMSRVRRHFRNRAVVVSHHMRKDHYQSRGADRLTLESDMRTWSDGARGSGALKAHADVIVCQERCDRPDETVWLGAFMKDGPDVLPTPLEETEHESYCWKAKSAVPEHLKLPLAVLRKMTPPFKLRAAVLQLMKAHVPQKSAYRVVAELRRRDLVTGDGEGEADSFVVCKTDAAPIRLFI